MAGVGPPARRGRTTHDERDGHRARAWSDETGAWHELHFDGSVVDDVAVADGALLFAASSRSSDGVASTGVARLEAR